MKKHYVLMEVTTAGNAKPNLEKIKESLTFGVKKHSFELNSIKFVEEIDEDKAQILALSDITSSHEYASDAAALRALFTAADKDAGVPQKITVWNPFEDYSASGVVDVLAQSCSGYIGKFQIIEGGK